MVLALILSPVAQPSPLSTMKCIGGIGMSGAGSHETVLAQDMVTPSRTREIARRVFSGVRKFRVPSWSSSPQRPQLLNDWK